MKHKLFIYKLIKYSSDIQIAW